MTSSIAPLWERVQKLDSDDLGKIQTLYNNYFPLEVRNLMADWIEEKFCTPAAGIGGFEGSDPNKQLKIINDFFILLKSRANSQDFNPESPLQKSYSSLLERFGKDPLSLYTFLKNTLTTEAQLVELADKKMKHGNVGFYQPQQQQQQQVPAQSMSSGIQASLSVMAKLKIVREKSLETREILKGIKETQESLTLNNHIRQRLQEAIQFNRIKFNPQTPQSMAAERNFLEQKNRIEFELTQKTISLRHLISEFETKSAQSISELREIQGQVQNEELEKWKIAEQFAGNGAPLDRNLLESLQEWFEELAELIWTHRQQLKDAEQLILSFIGSVPESLNAIRVLQDMITQLLYSLVISSFIVENQPPQVIKTINRFSSKVRLLVGGRLNIQMDPPQVTVRIINEKQKIRLMRAEVDQDSLDSAGDIINNKVSFSYHEDTRKLRADFKSMKLKQNVRRTKSSTESVTDEKFCLSFHCQFKIGDVEFKIWTLSLPVVVIVHGSQESGALATIIYDNAFGPPGRPGFQTPDRVPWKQMADVLSMKFKSMSGRGFTEGNINFLAEKIFKTEAGGTIQEYCTWSQFCKEKLPGRDYGFWDWFYSFMKLIHEHLRGLWIDGSIIGFISKEQAEELLRGTGRDGTFLLRASESELGAVVFFCYDNANTILKIGPVTSKELMIRSLPDQINDYAKLKYLYPNKPKSEAFSKYYTPVKSGNGPGGYVKQVPIFTLPNAPGSSASGDTHMMDDGSSGAGGLFKTEPSSSPNPFIVGVNSPNGSYYNEDSRLDASVQSHQDSSGDLMDFVENALSKMPENFHDYELNELAYLQSGVGGIPQQNTTPQLGNNTFNLDSMTNPF